MKKKNSEMTPAGVGEKLQYLVHESNDNTVRCQLLYPAHISEKNMESAVLYVVRNIDVLHSSFLSENGKQYWKENADVSEKDCFRVEYAGEDPMVLSDRAMLKSVAPQSKAQLFCTLTQGETESALTLIISHLCVDGGDAKYLLEKIAEAYNLLAQGKNLSELKLKNGSRSTFQMYDNLSKREFLSAFKGTETEGQSPFPFPDTEAGTPHLIKRKLEPALVKKLRLYGKEKDASINDVLLTAFYRAYLALPGAYTDGAVSIMSMMDLRRHRKSGQSDGLCNMSGMMPTVVKENLNGSFADMLAEISAQTKAVKADNLAGLHGLPMIHIMAKLLPMSFFEKKMGSAYRNMSIGMTNLGNLPADKLILGGICPKEADFAGPLKKKPGMQIAVTGFDGAVTLITIGEYTDKDAEFISGLMENMENILESEIPKCDTDNTGEKLNR